MTAKQYLRQVERLDVEIVQLRERLEDMWTTLTSVTADPSKEFVDGSKKGGNMADGMLDELDRLTRTLSAKRTEAVILRAEISLQVQELENPKFVRILYRRYIDHVPLDALAAEMCYDYYYFARLHGRALQAFAERFPDLLKEDKESQIEM